MTWLVPAFVLASAVVGRLLDRYQLDDPFITYRYAQNLAGGQGFVYNAGERVLSTTSPLFALLLGAIGWIGLDVPAAGHWIGALSIAAAALALYRTGTALGRPAAGLVAAILMLSSSDALLTFGLESTFYLALLAWTVWAAVVGRSGLAGVCLGLATLTRGDAVLLGPILLVLWLCGRRRFPWRAAAGWIVVTAPWAVFATWYFGWPLPATLSAKMQQGRSGLWDLTFLTGLGPAWQDWHVGISALFWWIVPLCAAGLWTAIARDRRWLVWPVWGMMYVGAYGLLGIPSYYWHYAPLVPALVVLAGLGSETLAEWLLGRAWGGRPFSPTLTALALALPLLAAHVQVIRYVQERSPWPFATVYERIGRELATEVPPTASIGSLEVGLLGYHSGRRMIDFAGLLQPPIAQHVGRGDFGWAVGAYRPEYIVWSPQRDRWLPEVPEFAAEYEEIRRIPNAYLDPLIISRRRAEG